MVKSRDQTEFEIRAAAEDKVTFDVMKFGELTPYICPDCHDVLFKLLDGARTRFRCHTGHAFSTDGLLSTVTESIEESLWNAIRCIDESVLLLNHLGDHFLKHDQPNLAAIYFKKAYEARDRGDIIRDTVLKHERLSSDRVRELAGDERGTEQENVAR